MRYAKISQRLRRRLSCDPSGIFPLEKRNAVYALYAFCRRVDDIADGDWLPDLSGIDPKEMSDLDTRTADRSVILSIDKQSEGSNPEPDHSLKLRALIHYRDMLARARMRGHSVSDPIFVALKDTFNRFPIRVSDLHQLIDGMEDDLYPTNYRSFEDLQGYCYKVASTVGLALIEIYGYENPDAREHAEEMGIFLQDGQYSSRYPRRSRSWQGIPAKR